MGERSVHGKVVRGAVGIVPVPRHIELPGVAGSLIVLFDFLAVSGKFARIWSGE